MAVVLAQDRVGRERGTLGNAPYFSPIFRLVVAKLRLF